jgi:hypothetical protein
MTVAPATDEVDAEQADRIPVLQPEGSVRPVVVHILYVDYHVFLGARAANQ